VIDDTDRWYAALRSRDPRFDGWFYVGVTSTGIYCRPSCPAMTPKRRNVRFHTTAAAAQAAGFRACKRCRPDATPGSPAWDTRADLVGRAMRLIADGIVDREGVTGLAARLGYSSRHVHRQLVAEVGAGPIALARAQRAQTARVLIETTSLPFGELAHAAGFASTRQFNATVQEVFATTPTQLRHRAGRGARTHADVVTLRLPHRRPFAAASILGHLAARAVPDVEEVLTEGHRRSLRLPHGTAVVDLHPTGDEVRATLRLDDLRDLTAAVQRCRRLLDLDADPVAVDDHLAADPALAPAVGARPGSRVPGTVDPAEMAVRAVLGQQVSVAAARTLAGRLAGRLGGPLTHPVGTTTRTFPTPSAIAGTDLGDLGVPRRRAETLVRLMAAVERGEVELDVGVDRSAARAALTQLPGIGPWTVEYVLLRALGDPDAFPATDLGIRRGAEALGLPHDTRMLVAHADRWRPWRAAAAQHLWAAAAAAAAPAPVAAAEVA
jgi:AraC family transcriptional regulator, regulatory protein of adaptative response / DNA-3-methyladenine glycosylase II